jgi:hypothetical protein
MLMKCKKILSDRSFSTVTMDHVNYTSTAGYALFKNALLPKIFSHLLGPPCLEHGNRCPLQDQGKSASQSNKGTRTKLKAGIHGMENANAHLQEGRQGQSRGDEYCWGRQINIQVR